MSAKFSVSIGCIFETGRLVTVSNNGGTSSGVKSGIRASDNNAGSGGIVGDVKPFLGVTHGTITYALGRGDGVLVVLTVSDGVGNISSASIGGKLLRVDLTFIVVARETGSGIVGATLA